MADGSIPDSRVAQRAVNAAVTVMAGAPRDADAMVVTAVTVIGASTTGIRTDANSGIGTSTRVRPNRR